MENGAPVGAFQHPEATSPDVNPDIRVKTVEREKDAGFQEVEEKRADDREEEDCGMPAKNRIETSLSTMRAREAPQRRDWMNTRASHVPGGTWLTQFFTRLCFH
ncbi:hypothetical protein NDU88_003432 [Pleurodeles waltl]|uniref:Uncharacterized protein n=1 Tax=Pleurodeles waltl TaxID=8319 RepID=A0AAV7WPD9_PLEWA|nr:hypothetical protein NDU88_003432 [Pleurodeles waltl]